MKKKKSIKYKGKVKNINYLSNPDLYQSYMILNTQKFEEMKSNLLIEIPEEKLSSNAKLLSNNSSIDAKIMYKKKKQGD